LLLLLLLLSRTDLPHRRAETRIRLRSHTEAAPARLEERRTTTATTIVLLMLMVHVRRPETELERTDVR
jgi:hypothetical protein